MVMNAGGAVNKRGAVVTSGSRGGDMVCTISVRASSSGDRPVHCRLAISKTKCGGVFQPRQRLVVHDPSYARGSAATRENLQRHGSSSAGEVQ